MAEEKQQPNNGQQTAGAKQPVVGNVSPANSSPRPAQVQGQGQFDRPRNRREFKKNSPRSRGDGKPKSEFDQKIIAIRRVTRVVAGGRRFSFSVAIVVGDRKGSVGGWGWKGW